MNKDTSSSHDALPTDLLTPTDHLMVHTHLINTFYREFCLMCIHYDIDPKKQRTILRLLGDRVKRLQTPV